jgi:hypothetical protein
VHYDLLRKYTWREVFISSDLCPVDKITKSLKSDA